MHRKFMILLTLVVLLLAGCAMRTADELYRLPKRSEEYNNLQNAMDIAMSGLEYSAPKSGDNQQTVQMADLNGDGLQEALLFARSTDTKQLKILVFSMENHGYVLTQTLESSGSDFEQVEYVSMDQEPGLELVVGHRVSDQVLRAVTVYGYRQDGFQELLSANYTKFLTCDLDEDDSVELFVLHPGMSDVDTGVAEWYYYADGEFERSTEVNLSEPVDHLKRLMVGKIHGNQPGIYVASTVDEDTILTDVFALVEGKLTNVALSNASDTSVQTLRNYYIFGDDIDNDGVMELPSLIPLQSLQKEELKGRQSMIRWYALTLNGKEVDKMYTYHNFVEGWYIRLEQDWLDKIYVTQKEDEGVVFYYWDLTGGQAKPMVSIQMFTGENRSVKATENNRIVLAKTDTVVYAASIDPAAAELGLTRENLADRFHLIYMDWKTGEM